MQTFSQLALPGVIVASAVGAVVLCVVLLVYGFRSEPDDERAPMRRLLLIRVGHALAAASFALALMLGTVALLEQRRTSAASNDQVRRLAARVGDLEQRLERPEARASDRGATLKATATGKTPEATMPTTTGASVLTPEAPPPVVTAPVSASMSVAVAAPPAPAETRRPPAALPPRQRKVAAAPRPSSPSDEFAARVREGWEALKRGYREAGRDIRGGFVDQTR